jgi:UDP-3-O-[3-hydroxymyristoyl] N-acetylglucosamine deacetylase
VVKRRTEALEVERESSSVLTGVGIHSGRNFMVRLSPNSNHSGIHFFTEHFQKRYETPALWTRLSGTSRSTALVLRGEDQLRFELRTVEHFLAAAFILGLEGVDVFVRSAGALIHSSEFQILELPVLEGSSRSWLRFIGEFIDREGLKVQRPRRMPVYRIHRSFEMKDGDRQILLLPALANAESQSQYLCEVDFGHHWQQSAEFSIDWLSPQVGRERFAKQIAPARTFGFQAELKDLEERGLAKGAALTNAVLLDGDKVVNQGGLLFENELAAHKLLDAIGDFALAGAPILGRIEARKGGHAAHLRALSEAMRSGALISGFLLPDGTFLPQS